MKTEMILAILAILISIASMIIAVMAHKEKKEPINLDNVKVDKISMPGFEIKIENGNLSINPKP